MEEEHEKRVRQWMLENYSWWLDDAIKLLFGCDPEINTEQLVLEGNDILARAGITVRQDISLGKLTPVNQRKREDGSMDYLVGRDDFVQWAKKAFTADGEELFAVWTDYKKGRPKVGQISKQERNREKWQAALDDLYIRRFKDTGGKNISQDCLCKELANILDGSSDTIRRYTKARNKKWIIGKIEEVNKSQNG